LGDAVAGLTKALKTGPRRAHRHASLSGHRPGEIGITFSRSCCVHFGRGEEIWVGIFEGKLDGEVPIWFIDYARYFDRPGIYDGQEDATASAC
jgi:hypothetical protein